MTSLSRSGDGACVNVCVCVCVCVEREREPMTHYMYIHTYINAHTCTCSTSRLLASSPLMFLYRYTVLHSKRVDFYHCVVFAVFLGETCMYPHLT